MPMTAIDNVDYEILQMLMKNARYSYREIADEVNRSPPTVSDRIGHLKEIGVIERFTLDINRAMLVEGPTVLVELDIKPGTEKAVTEELTDIAAVEHIIQTIDATVIFVAHANEQDIQDLLSEALGNEQVRDYSVRLVSESIWKPRLDEETLAIECIVCGKAIDGDNESVDLGEDTYEVCCTSCASEIRDQFNALEEAASK